MAIAIRKASEIEKLSVNLKDKKSIDADDIEKFIGISKEYNIFELQAAIAKKDLAKAWTLACQAVPTSARLRIQFPE